MSILRRVAGVLALGFLLVACASDYTYQSHDASGLYYRLPRSWTALSLPDTQTPATNVSYLKVLDGDRDPELAHLDQVTDEPVGVVQVLTLTAGQRDSLSLATLRQLATNGDGDPFDLQDTEGSGVVVLRYSDLEVDGGYKGNRIAFSKVGEDGVTEVTEQLALVDPSASQIFQLLIRCSETCFDEHKGDIDVVLDSWNVKA